MGYAIIDKNKVRDPPLPPPRTLRNKRSVKTDEDKFFTVPRRHADGVPTRPLRNYSTLTQVKKTFEHSTNPYENKENIDVGYVEIEDEHNIDLQSGEIIQKMKDRPLPAPPRPPRKSRLDDRLLQDITSRENIITDLDTEVEKQLEETDTATQTEPLPDDFICEEMVQEPTDTIIMASRSTEDEPAKIETHIITPTLYQYEETITHGSLLVDPLDGAKILPDSELTRESKERIIPITRESDIDETSSIPEDFHKLKQPSHTPKETLTVTETEVMKTQKLQVADLDVDTLTVHKLLADKILVSEIESGSVSTNEISSKTGSLKVGEINLPPGVIEEIIRTIQSSIPVTTEQISITEPRTESTTGEQKKTSLNKQISDPFLQYEPECLPVLPDEEVNLSNSTPPECSPIHHDHEESLSCPMPPHLATNLEQLEGEIENIEPQNVPPPKTSIDKPEDEIRNVVPQNSPPQMTSIENPEYESRNLEQLHQTNESLTETPVELETFSVDERIPPPRPPRQSEKAKSLTPPFLEECPVKRLFQEQHGFEPEVDDEPPPRPPQPQLHFIPSQPPASFYALRARKYVESLGENIPVVPRRRRHTRSRPRTRSSSEDSSEATPSSRRAQRRLSDPPLSQLTMQLATACGTEINNSLKRLITYILKNVLGNEDGKQDLNVMIIIILVLLTGLILLGYGDEKTVVHLHHWEYFNPPRDS